MSAYSNQMVTELCASAHTYESAAAFASKHNISVRSVVSKIKSLGLGYERKVVVKSGVVRVKKDDVVRVIASKLGMEYEAISGLGNASMSALQELVRVI